MHAGIADVELGPDAAHLRDWLAQGQHGRMEYMQRHGDKRSRPAVLLPGTLRVLSVRMQAQGAPAYSLVSRDDRFRPDDAPSGAMRDSHAGDDVASALEAFDIEDVAAGEAPKTISQRLDYALVDGEVLAVTVWRDGLRDWASVDATLDPGIHESCPPSRWNGQNHRFRIAP